MKYNGEIVSSRLNVVFLRVDPRDCCKNDVFSNEYYEFVS